MKTNRIKEVRLSRNLTQKDLASKLGISQSHIAMLENGDRSLDIDLITNISKELKVSPMDILPLEFSQPKAVTTIYKIGAVQAGKWNEACQLPEDEWKEIPYPLTDNLKNKKIFALDVKGESMNIKFPPNKTILICCSIYSLTKEPENGDYVIAYRKKDGLCEATVKKYYKNEVTGEIILIAESTDPRYTNIVIGKDAEYEIGAVVIDFMTKLRDL